MSFWWSFTVNLIIYYISTVIARYTKGRLGSGIVAIVIMLAGFWSGLLPKDVVKTGYFNELYALVMIVFVVHLGTSFNGKQLRREWRLVLVTLSGIVGIGIMCLIAGRFLFGRNIAMISFPSLVGGSVTTLIMRDAAVEKGWFDLAGIVAILSSMQVWIGIPMITAGSQKECSRLLKLYRKNPASCSGGEKWKPDTELAEFVEVTKAAEEKIPLVERLPSQWKTEMLPLVIIAIVGAAGKSLTPYAEAITHTLIGFSVIALNFGILGRQAGIIPKEPLQKAGVFPFFLFAMLTSLRGNLASLTPMDIAHNIVPLLGLLLLGAVGILAFTIPVGRALGLSPWILIAFSFGMYAGYPLNYQAALEAIEVSAKTEDERNFLKDRVLTKVVLGSVLGQTIASIVIAGIFVSLL
ncbi:MAG: hypothetical protein LBH73_08325 [Spirochaetaceae bacterium]|jgi:hypothetical protein|nr:hypothetical protein [Spirochaetaceae bacterium]